MYLFQKFGYKRVVITEDNKDEALELMKGEFYRDGVPKICGFDTETTGLNIIKDTPFLFVFGFKKIIFEFEPTKDILDVVYELSSKTQRLFAHNTKYDYHMMCNFGYEIPENIKLADSMSVARITNYADEEARLSLEAVGSAYVDKDAKFAGKVIKRRITELNAQRKKVVKENVSVPKGKTFSQMWDAYQKRVAFVNADHPIFKEIDKYYKPATYYDVYLDNKDLMLCYACDDVVIMLEYLEKALPVLMEVDPNLCTFNRECDLIRAICTMERVGIKVNVDYLLDRRNALIDYRKNLYTKLWGLIGVNLSVGQHKEIIKVFKEKFGVVLFSADKDSLTKMVTSNEEAKECAKLIIELRTVDKWLSTYIDGKLNAIIDGRIHTTINNEGAVSGRVSCDMQQQPKEPLLDRDGNALFHPRRAFVCDDDSLLVFADFSQMELRMQAYYTIKCGQPDINLCRAYMPYKCHSMLTGEEFDFNNLNHLAQWNSGEWLHNEDDSPWEEVDLHTLTTFNAFPHLNGDKSHPEFKHLRRLGKMCNFLKNYQGGEKAIMEQLDVPQDIAKKLDEAYYKSFPSIKVYQSWVERELSNKGFVDNLYGRRYYIKSYKNYYKGCNYVIQGSCADFVKNLEIEIVEFLKPYKTRFILPIHDELVFTMPKEEVFLIPKIKELMEDREHIVRNVPMICDVEYSTTNWAEKKDYVGDEIW